MTGWNRFALGNRIRRAAGIEFAGAINLRDSDRRSFGSLRSSRDSGKCKASGSAIGFASRNLTNNDGYFTFASVPVGTYDLPSKPKVSSSQGSRGSLGGGEKRNVDVTLKVGTTSETVEVTGADGCSRAGRFGREIVHADHKELQNLRSRRAATPPSSSRSCRASASQNGTSNKSQLQRETIGINGNGDAGSQSPLNNAFSYNGLPSNSLDITADGAHVSDPGCNCDTPVNPNSDMISEFKVKTSNFSAENQKGPAVITSVAKSGGKDFHGSGFFYARNYAMNANDALFNANGQTATGEQVLLSRLAPSAVRS